MHRPSSLLVGLLTLIIGLIGMFGTQVRAAGPVSEVEPNNTCFEAQDLGVLDESISVTGDLDGQGGSSPYPPPDAQPNVDYFKITAPPGSLIEVLVGASSSGLGTLVDPIVGIYNLTPEGCFQTQAVDNGGNYLDPRVITTVNETGDLLIAVTSCCDFGFVSGGSGNGTYTLQLQTLQVGHSINGRVIDNRTGEPPPENVTVELARCVNSACAFVALTTVDSLGRFSFVHNTVILPDPYPGPADPLFSDFPRYLDLYTGQYQISVFAPFYEGIATDIFNLGINERVNLGQIALTGVPRGQQIDLRVVDAVTAEPLSSDQYPFLHVQLFRCDEFGCNDLAGFASSDANGQVSITRGDSFNGLLVGDYVISLFAEEYIPLVTEPFAVGADAVVDLGDIKLQPNPVRLSNAQGCEPIPAQGGRCPYKIEVTNRQEKVAQLQVWSVVASKGIGQPYVNGVFQPDKATKIRLRSGETKTITFMLDVPRGVTNGAYFCATAFVAEDVRGFYFNAVAQSNIFCSFKDGDGVFRTVPADTARELIQRLNGVPANQRNRR